MKRLVPLHAALLTAAAFALAGCASLDYDYAQAPVALQAVSATGNVAVAVQDLRPYVLSGGKPETFVGIARGTMGLPLDVSTTSGAPVARELAELIAKALNKRGATAVAVSVSPRDSAVQARDKAIAAKPRRAVLVTLREWKTDTMYKTDMEYDTTLVVLDEGGKELATRASRGDEKLTGAAMTPHAAIYSAVGKKLEALFEDPKIVAALK
jgi:hypothetical protein